MPHRSEPQTRMEDWGQRLPPAGGRALCSWARLCVFARAPETRQVAVAAWVSVAGVRYAVDPDLAGAPVPVWFGLYDDQRYVEHEEKRYGPYAPIDGPIHRYRRFKKTWRPQRAERIEGWAASLSRPRAALRADPVLSSTLSAPEAVPSPFVDPEPLHALTLPSALDAKQAMAHHWAFPWARLAPEPCATLHALLNET